MSEGCAERLMGCRTASLGSEKLCCLGGELRALGIRFLRSGSIDLTEVMQY